MTACGGGGSDAGSPSPPPANGGGGGDGGPGDGGSGGSPDPAGDGQADVLFPWRNSGATSSTVVVRGLASDPDGVAKVLVNGVAAAVKARAALASAPEAEAGGFQVLVADASGSTLDEPSGTSVEWSVELALQNGLNKLVVAVEDENGETTVDEDAASIMYREVPVFFTLDEDRSRVVGLSYSLTPSGHVQRIVQHDYVTGQQRVFQPDPSKAVFVSAGHCFRASQDEFLYLVLQPDRQWHLRSFDLETELDSLLLAIPPDSLDPGDGFYDSPFGMQLVCSGSHDNAYLLASYADIVHSQLAKSRVLSIDLSALSVEVLTETTAEAAPWLASHIALAGDALISLQDINPVAPLTRIALTDGARSVLTPGLNVGGTAIAPALEQGLVYVATVNGLDEVTVAGDPDSRNISPAPEDDEFAFIAARALAFDPANGRAIVGSEDTDALVAINVTTGARSEFVSRRIGTGLPLTAARRFALTVDDGMAYVIDDGIVERLFEIDLATGNRRVIGDISRPFHNFLTGIALDESDRRVFVAYQDGVIIEVDIDSGGVRTLADTGWSGNLLTSIGDLLFDPEHGRLLVTDPSTDAIVALDVLSRQQQILSKEGVRGAGEGFADIGSMTRDPGSSHLYVANRANPSIMRVDVESGDRELFLSTCISGSNDSLGQDVHLAQVLYNGVADELLILADGVLTVDPETRHCSLVWPGLSLFPLAIEVTQSNQFLATTFRELVQLDRESINGQLVIVSK